MQTNKELFEQAKQWIPGGVNSPVRAFKSVGGTPVFIDRAKGAYMWDVEGKQYIDYIGSWGPSILGHANQEVLEALSVTMQNGLTFGAPHENETLLAKMIVEALPSVDKVRMVSSGTEACMSAIRLARGFTERNKIIKFDGNYHGHADMLLAKAGSGVATFGLPDCPGVPKETAEATLTATYNNLESVERLLESNKNEVAAIILEPIVGNSGFIRGSVPFLKGLRELCDQHKSLLIFDEVMTGFRVTYGGVQTLHDIKPDLTCLGKVVGGGLPLAAYAGRGDIMDCIAPDGPVYQAGTLSGNPLAVTTGKKTLEILKRESTHEKLALVTKKLVDGFKSIGASKDIPISVDHEGGMFGMNFCKENIQNFDDAKAADAEMFKSLHAKMLGKGIYLAPSAFEAGFVSACHTDSDIEKTLECFEQSLGDIR